MRDEYCLVMAGLCEQVCCGMCNCQPPEGRVTIEDNYTNTALGCGEKKDNVTLPDHYARFKFEPVHFIGENKLDWFQGNIIKYVCRYDAKNGIEDLNKAKRYLEMYIKYLNNDPDWWKK